MRNRINSNLFCDEGEDLALRKGYDVLMFIAVIASMIPLCFKDTNELFIAIELMCTVLFVADYVLRLATADLRMEKGAMSFVAYPFTPMAILDLLSILPGLIEINPAFRVLRLARLLKLLRIFRLVRYSKSLNMVRSVIRREKNLLLCVLTIAVAYILVSSMIVFNVEPDTFDTFFDAIYWSCVSLTTVGYGDIFCTSTAGKVFTIVGSFVGIAIVALPAGIITGGFVDEMKSKE